MVRPHSPASAAFSPIPVGVPAASVAGSQAKASAMRSARGSRASAGGGGGGGGGSVAIAHSAYHLAVGLVNGGVKIIETEKFEIIQEVKDCISGIDDLKYSPCAQYLATASHDCVVDVYRVAADPRHPRGYRHIARCVGHSATVAHVDWSADSSTLMSNCNGYEIL